VFIDLKCKGGFNSGKKQEGKYREEMEETKILFSATNILAVLQEMEGIRL
jgi:hypothetical protein